MTRVRPATITDMTTTKGTTMTTPRHNLDTTVDRLGEGWIYCAHCGWPIRADEQDTTSCDPQKQREFVKYVNRQSRIARLEARMEARQQAFDKAQAADRLAIYRLRNNR